MALTDENGMNTTMLVSPTNGFNNGFGNAFGNDGGWWIILLFILLGGGGMWGMNGGFGNMYEFPWLLNGQQNINTNTNAGFRDAMVNDGINSIRDSIGNLSTQLCGSTASVTQALNSGFTNAETAANARQMANMQTAFAGQTAMSQGFNSIGLQLCQASGDNRLATCQTQNIVQNEGNATRFADANNTRDIIQSQTNGTQAILDKLCQLELDGVKAQVEAKNDRIAELQTQLNMANLAASQTAQNALIQQGFTNEVDALYNRLSTCPVPTTPVYGRTPIFTCNSCGCSGNTL